MKRHFRRVVCSLLERYECLELVESLGGDRHRLLSIQIPINLKMSQKRDSQCSDKLPCVPIWKICNPSHCSKRARFRCQSCCPANREVIKLTGRLEDVTEEETRRILDGTPDKELLDSLSRKLKGFYPTQSEEDFPVLTRNLRVLLRPEVNPSGWDPAHFCVFCWCFCIRDAFRCVSECDNLGLMNRDDDWNLFQISQKEGLILLRKRKWARPAIRCGRGRPNSGRGEVFLAFLGISPGQIPFFLFCKTV